MNSTAKSSLCFLSLLIMTQQSQATTVAPVSVKKIIAHLFEPINRHFSQKDLDTLCKVVESRIEKGESYITAFNDEVQKFLHSQITAAYVEIAKQQKNETFTTEDAQATAAFVITEIMVKGYAQKCHANLFEQDPMTLPEHLFAFFTTHYFVTAHSRVLLPAHAQNRMDMATLIEYAHFVRVGLSYATTGIKYANAALDAFGVPQA